MKAAGIIPALRQESIRVRILGPTVSKTSLNNLVGMRSREQIDIFMCLTTSDKRNRDTGSNWLKTAEQEKQLDQEEIAAEHSLIQV